MTNILKKAMLFIALILSVSTGFAQENGPIEMATGLYQSGKIYVVVIVISLIFVGIAGYLILLDRKISKLEKEK